MDERYEVNIVIASRVEDEVFEQSTTGILYRRESGSWYIRYEETDDEGHATRTIVRFTVDEVKVKRSGAVDSEMLFAAGLPREGYYQSGGIKLLIKTVMRSCRIELERGQGSASLEYDLYIGDAPTQRHQITYSISPLF